METDPNEGTIQLLHCDAASDNLLSFLYYNSNGKSTLFCPRNAPIPQHQKYLLENHASIRVFDDTGRIASNTERVNFLDRFGGKLLNPAQAQLLSLSTSGVLDAGTLVIFESTYEHKGAGISLYLTKRKHWVQLAKDY
jgi:hypothetical protein